MTQKFVKIIGVSNFDDETMSDTLVAERVVEVYARDIVNSLNDSGGENSYRYYKIVPEDHKLYVWEP